ncbi:class I SAM-dependent methyltransferase [Thermofilum pendens]|uniref:tRNA (guanine(37)-N(1))-methyltransferase n=1 Tax=Thermofilum pendens (strain DSM 2475 / Hrk 5) TaxID=368408 RepID=A1RYD0_THEPD|nr:class I SAM-dependent methyltransferase family protein [Thermofilum pendens]ABL78210.1 methyltransferase [Thermofilum pendens Hrk 5]
MRVRDVLRGKIPENLLPLVPSSFDVVGSREAAVAIVELPDELLPYKEAIAEAILQVHKNVKAVYRKLGGRVGEYRVRELELIGGEPITEVVHKEHGYRLKLDVTKVYFSPREATERQRIARQVKPGETVMVMFAGVGPYAIAIAKAQPRVEKVIAIELNPAAYAYMVENVKLNKVEGLVVPVLGDVREKAREWYGSCDRVVMPLPRGAYMFLDEAVRCLKSGGGWIHFYYWDREDDLFAKAFSLVKEAAEKHGFRAELRGARIVSPYSPRTYKVAIDVLLSSP